LVEPIYSESPDWSTNPLTGQAPPQINGIKKKVNGQKENKKKVKKKSKKSQPKIQTGLRRLSHSGGWSTNRKRITRMVDQPPEWR